MAANADLKTERRHCDPRGCGKLLGEVLPHAPRGFSDSRSHAFQRQPAPHASTAVRSEPRRRMGHVDGQRPCWTVPLLIMIERQRAASPPTGAGPTYPPASCLELRQSSPPHTKGEVNALALS